MPYVDIASPMLIIYLIVRLSISIYNPCESKDAGKFLCEPYYGKQLKLLKSIRNESIRLSVLEIPDPTASVTFDEALELCQKCVNGTLVMHDDVTQLESFLPTWLGIEYKQLKSGIAAEEVVVDSNIGILSAPTETDDYAWLDGSPVNRWQRNYAVTFYAPSSGSQNAIYAVRTSSGRSSSLSPNMDWFSLRKDSTPDMQIMLFRSNSAHTLLYHHGIEEQMKFVVCERPVRKNCYYWNYTEEACLNLPRFGCHNYINLMYSDPDPIASRSSENVTCTPDYRRRAIKCPCSICSCPVTEWSQWSSCGLEICSGNPMQRSRTRKQVDSNCPVSYRRFELTEHENCSVPGCAELEQHFDNCAIS